MITNMSVRVKITKMVDLLIIGKMRELFSYWWVNFLNWICRSKFGLQILSEGCYRSLKFGVVLMFDEYNSWLTHVKLGNLWFMYI